MIENLRERDALMQSIRAFFHSEGFIEVETPIRMKIPCMELHIDAEPSGDRWLRTSPELYHKKLLARGAQRIFEIGKCFRQGERGDRHHPEYTMLEWYRAEADYNAMLADTQNLLASVAAGGDRGLTRPADASTEDTDSNVWKCRRDAPVAFSNTWKIWTIAEIYQEFAGWDPVENFDADRFDFDMVEKIEPNLPKDRPVILMDYPAECCALARLKPDNPKVAERWELYLGGIEIANAYSELTDPVEQRARFEKWGEQRRALGKTVYPIDEEFIQCLDPSAAREAPLLRGNDRGERQKMPPSGGCALGIDRLLMVLVGTNTLDDILPFR